MQDLASDGEELHLLRKGGRDPQAMSLLIIDQTVVSLNIGSEVAARHVGGDFWVRRFLCSRPRYYPEGNFVVSHTEAAGHPLLRFLVPVSPACARRRAWT